MQTKAVRRDYEDFLLSAYFGNKSQSDPMATCVDYPEYFSRQEWIRRTFTMVPLDVELFAWMNSDFDLTPHLKRTPPNAVIG